MLNLYPCSLCYKFHVQRTKQDLQFGKTISTTVIVSKNMNFGLDLDFEGSFCCVKCKHTFQKYFGRSKHSLKSRRVQKAIWRLYEEIEDRTKCVKSN